MFVLKKKQFLQEYRIENIYLKAEEKGLKWKTLQNIYKDYKNNYLTYYNQQAGEVVEKLMKNAPAEATIIYGRAKQPEHLIEKIIRKIGKEDKADYFDINVNNYREIVTDLIGIRVLILKKEDWDIVDQHIHKKYKKFIEWPVAYVCYGDRDIYDKKRINTRYTNKGYRSQHYIVQHNKCICEIQVRTLAEQVYGEYDHKVRYPYRQDSNFLARYNRIISKVTSELDDLISTSLNLSDENIDILDKNFSQDTYRDWSREIDENMSYALNDDKAEEYNVEMQGRINAIEHATNRIMQRGR